MKQKLFLLLVTTMFLSQTFAKPLPYHIHFGNWRKDCRGFGICDIHDLNIDTKELPNATAENTGHDLRISIPTPLTDAFREQIAGGYFVLEEDYAPPAFFLEQQSLPDNFTFEAGKYPCIQNSDQIIISFGY